MEIKAQGRTILKPRQEWQYQKTSCSVVSAGKKPGLWVLKPHWTSSQLIWTFFGHYLFTTHQHFCPLSYVPAPPHPHSLSHIMSGLMLCKDSSRECIHYCPETSINDAPSSLIPNQVLLALAKPTLWHIPMRKKAKWAGFFLISPGRMVHFDDDTNDNQHAKKKASKEGLCTEYWMHHPTEEGLSWL